MRTIDLVRDAQLRAVLLITFVVMLGFGLIAPALPLYARSFGVSYAAVGFLLSGFGAVRLVSQPVGGRLIERYGERRMAIIGVSIVGASSLASGLAPSFWALVVARSLGGAGSAWFITSLTTYTMGIVSRDRVGQALSVYQASFTAGVTMGPVAGGFLASSLGLRAPFFAYAGFCAASAVVAAIVLRGRAGGAPPGDRAAGLRRSGLLSDRLFVIALCANGAIWWLLSGSRITLVPLYAEGVLGASEAWIGTVLTLAAVASLVTLPHAGRLSDRLDRRNLGPALAVASVMVASFGLARSQPVFAVLLAGMGAVQGYARVPTVALVADRAPEAMRGRAVAAQQMAGDLGGLLAPTAAGVAATALGFEAAFALVAFPPAVVGTVAAFAARRRG